MTDCDHGIWTLRIVEREPRLVVAIRCALCNDLLWIGNEDTGVTGEGGLVKME
jgi:hypothetical protein